MAQLVVSAVGAAVGFMVGGPAGAQIGWVAGSMVGAYAFAENQTHEGPRLKDLKITGTDYGDTIPWVAGSPRIAGQIIWASNRRETRHEEEVGGKGGGGGATQVTYTYDCDLLILLTENPDLSVSRIWSNNELVWNGGLKKEGVWRDINLYTGSQNQMPDPTYEAAVGVGNAPAYRGRTSVMIRGLQLGGSGTIPNITFEIGSPGTYPKWKSTYAKIKQIAVGLEKFDYRTPISGGANAYIRESSPFEGRRYVEFDLSETQLKRGWLFGAFRADMLDYTSSQTSIGVYGVRNTNFDNANPALVVNGNSTPMPDSFLINADWSDRFGVLIDNTNRLLTVYRNGIILHSWSDIPYSLNPCFITYSKGGDSHIATIIMKRGEWRYAPDNVLEYINTADGFLKQEVNVSASILLSRAGYKPDDFTTSGLASFTKPLRALALSQVSSTRSALEVLQKCWHFECSTTDKLRLFPRATTPVVRIPFADLGFSSSTGGLDDPLTIRMGNDLEMPAQIALTYPNMAGDYNADSQFSDRLISGQQSTQAMQVPVGMLPAEAKGVADALLMDALAGMQSTTLSVPLKYAFVEPGDVVEAVAQDGRIYRLRVQTRKDQGIWLELECKLDDVGALDSAAITDEGYITVQDPASVPDTVLHALDVPLLRDADDQPGFYLAVAPDSVNVATDQWKGANVASSWDDVDYASLLSILEAATVGEALTVLPAWSGGPVFDEASVLRVEMLGQLSSTNRGAMLLDESVNALLVGDEIVRFRNAELVDADEDRGRYTYQLTGFIRGFRGTEWAMGSHVAGERCVLLNRGVRRINTQLNALQVQCWLKATTVGKYISDVQSQAFTDTGRALKPFAPVGLRALTEEGAGVYLSWQRRTRLSYRYGGLSPSVPLGEATERYRVQVFAGDLLLRTEIVAQPSYEYTTTLTATDGLSAGDPVRFEVCQLSESVGAGYITTKEGFAA